VTTSGVGATAKASEGEDLLGDLKEGLSYLRTADGPRLLSRTA
jgi:hypothetical protein